MHENDPSVPIDAEFLAQMDGAFTGWGDPAQRLRKALAGDELQLYMQPIAKLEQRRFVMAAGRISPGLRAVRHDARP